MNQTLEGSFAGLDIQPSINSTCPRCNVNAYYDEKDKFFRGKRCMYCGYAEGKIRDCFLKIVGGQRNYTWTAWRPAKGKDVY